VVDIGGRRRLFFENWTQPPKMLDAGAVFFAVKKFLKLKFQSSKNDLTSEYSCLCKEFSQVIHIL